MHPPRSDSATSLASRPSGHFPRGMPALGPRVGGCLPDRRRSSPLLRPDPRTRPPGLPHPWGKGMNHDRQSLLPTPNPRPGLRLLCVLVRKAGHPIAQPVAVSGLPVPWAALSGRWPLALPSPFLLRETRPVPASAEVLARCVRQRETHALCARARSISIGGLTHAR